MSNFTKAFVDRQNIVRYFELLKIETDAVRRAMLAKPSTEEMAKQGNGQKTK
jgi:hypothetical protein